MDPGTGKIYASVDAAKFDGVKDPVEIIGTEEAVGRISAAVRAANKKRRKAAKKARKRRN